MENKQLTQDEIIKLAAEAGAKAGIDRYESEVKKQRRKKIDMRLGNTARLMRHYREIKLNAKDAITSLKEAEAETFDFFKSMMEEGDAKIDVKAIVAAKARSAVMVAHMDAMLGILAQLYLNSTNPVEVRKYREFEARYILDPPYTPMEIAQKENVDKTTVYRDCDEMCERLSSLLFGIQAVSE